MPPLSLLIKPASGLCNLRCRYCFYHDVAENREVDSYGIMSEKTLENVLEKALAASEDEITIAYQGGEPTLAGLDFFKKSVEIQNAHNRKRLRINNAIQTNGFHLTPEWAEFFRDNHFLVGLSVDGIMDVHDGNRVDAGGAGTFSAIMKTADLFDQYRVDYNILTVVTLPLARRVRAAYRFFKRRGFRYLQFIPCLDPWGSPSAGRNTPSRRRRTGDSCASCSICGIRTLNRASRLHPRLRQLRPDAHGLPARVLQPAGRVRHAVCSGGGRVCISMRLLRAGRDAPRKPQRGGVW